MTNSSEYTPSKVWTWNYPNSGRFATIGYIARCEFLADCVESRADRIPLSRLVR